MAVNKKSATSAAEMEALLIHAVIAPKAKTGEAKAETRAAQELGVQLLGIARTMPVLRTWRARSEAGGQVALVTVAETATAAEREQIASAAQDLEAARESLEGLLPVRALGPSRDAFLTDLWLTGTAKDLSALSWPLRHRLEFARAATRALAGLHGLGLVHGSFCAANVLLDDDLNPVLSEVGLVSVQALLARKEAADYEPFAAPEVLEGGEPDARSDVYSAGRLIQGLFAAGEEMPREVKELVDKCAMPAPLRYPSAEDLGKALQAAIDALPAEPVKAPPVEPRPPQKREAPEAAAPGPSYGKEEPSKPWNPPAWLGLSGIGIAIASFAAPAFLGGSNDALRALLLAALLLGAALATTLAPPLPRVPTLGRLALAGGVVAIGLILDPLAFASRIAAQRQLHGDAASRRKAIDEIVRLGRDFRGLSLAGLDLAGLDLTGADLRRVSLAGANLTGTKLFAAEVDGTSFDGAQLAGADLQQTSLDLANLGNATCDGTTRLPSTFACIDGRIDRNRTAMPRP